MWETHFKHITGLKWLGQLASARMDVGRGQQWRRLSNHGVGGRNGMAFALRHSQKRSSGIAPQVPRSDWCINRAQSDREAKVRRMPDYVYTKYVP